LRTIFVLSLVTASALAQSQPASKQLDIQSHLGRAEAALRSNDQEAAAREFAAVLSLDPKNVEARTNQGVIEFHRGNCDSAGRDLGLAVRAQPSLTRPRALLGICQRRLGDPQAQKTLEWAFAKMQDAKLQTQVGLELAG